METNVMFLDCPAYMDSRGSTRCGLPAEVEDGYTVRSSDGPLESVRIRCPRGHWFNGPVESLIWAPQARTRQAHDGRVVARPGAIPWEGAPAPRGPGKPVAGRRP